MTAPEYITTGKDIIVTAAAVAATIIGWRGLNTWKKQLIANTDIALAQKILISVHELIFHIEVFRQPFKSYSPLPESETAGLSFEQKEWKASVKEYQRLWAPIAKAVGSLQTNSWEVKAVWIDGKGERTTERLRQLEINANELYFSVREYLEGRNPDEKHDDSAIDWKELRSKLFSRTKDDSYKERLEAAVRAIEEELHEVIRKHKR